MMLNRRLRARFTRVHFLETVDMWGRVAYCSQQTWEVQETS
jgi:hypothetical protein